MNGPKISVAMCTYNGAQYITKQLDSILSQKYRPYEIVICDDDSQDNTVLLISELLEEVDIPVQVLVQQGNVGINNNFATAILMCSGEYIALADQDDIWSNEKLQIFADTIERFPGSKPLLLYSGFRMINERGEPLKKSFSEYLQLGRRKFPHWKRLAFGNFIPGCTMVFSSRAVKQVLPIPPEAVLHDWWIALVCSLHADLKYIDQELIFYRIHADNNQGINSVTRTFNLVLRFGAVLIASNNFLLALRQLGAAKNRLHKLDLPEPMRLAGVCDIQSVPWIIRPYILMKNGVVRFRVLLISMLAGRRQACDDSVGHL